jgi:hypothetical protein
VWAARSGVHGPDCVGERRDRATEEAGEVLAVGLEVAGGNGGVEGRDEPSGRLVEADLLGQRGGSEIVVGVQRLRLVVAASSLQVTGE